MANSDTQSLSTNQAAKLISDAAFDAVSAKGFIANINPQTTLTPTQDAELQKATGDLHSDERIIEATLSQHRDSITNALHDIQTARSDARAQAADIVKDHVRNLVLSDQSYRIASNIIADAGDPSIDAQNRLKYEIEMFPRSAQRAMNSIKEIPYNGGDVGLNATTRQAALSVIQNYSTTSDPSAPTRPLLDPSNGPEALALAAGAAVQDPLAQEMVADCIKANPQNVARAKAIIAKYPGTFLAAGAGENNENLKQVFSYLDDQLAKSGQTLVGDAQGISAEPPASPLYKIRLPQQQR